MDPALHNNYKLNHSNGKPATWMSALSSVYDCVCRVWHMYYVDENLPLLECQYCMGVCVGQSHSDNTFHLDSGLQGVPGTVQGWGHTSKSSEAILKKKRGGRVSKNQWCVSISALV